MSVANPQTGDRMTSRFFTTSDSRAGHLVLPLPPVWWSRPFEYAWAAELAEGAGTVLDAACGVEHPFKFHLLDRCSDVHACDLDERVLSREATLEELRRSYGDEAVEGLHGRYLTDIRYERASLTRLPYPDRMFDRVFCISVLEHLNDFFNRHAAWSVPRPLLFAFPHDIERTHREFRRILKDDGLLVITFDYPDINLDYLFRITAELGLAPAGDVKRDIPPDALFSESLGLRCFRLVLRKDGSARAESAKQTQPR